MIGSGAALAAGAAGVAGSWGIAHARSPSVRRWRPSALRGQREGALWARSGGAGDEVVVLLHGLVANSDVFGAPFDAIAADAVVVVPDLLGFGRSLDTGRSRANSDDHLDALDDLLESLGVNDRPLVLGGHSMGAAVAARWAVRRGAQVRRLVAWGAPVYRDEHHVRSTIASTGPMTRLFVADSRAAEWACGISCRHRRVAGWAASAMTPSLPIGIARGSSLHTWPVYRDAMTDLVMGTDWETTVNAVVDAGVEMRFVWGASDPIGDAALARGFAGAEVHAVEGADHRLPLTHGSLCVDHLASGTDGATTSMRAGIATIGSFGEWR